MKIKRGQGFDATIPHFYEAPLNSPDYLEVWCYTDQLSYEVGEEVQLHLNTTAADISLGICRDGAHTGATLPNTGKLLCRGLRLAGRP